MSKQSDRQQMEVIGWFQPHRAVDWDGLVPDKKTGELVKELSMTKQSFVAECDINNIVRDFTLTGQVAHINEHAGAGVFVDLPDTMDYQAGLELVRRAAQAFDALPAQLRARFDNNAAIFLDFMDDPNNQEEMISLGLAKDLRPPAALPPLLPLDAPPKPPEPPKA